MLTLYIFILFALFLGWSFETFAPRRPLLQLSAAPVCRACGRGWAT
jgi:hypothetical protein